MNSMQSFILGSMHLLDKRNITHVLIGRSTQTQDLNFEWSLQNQKFNKYKKSFQKYFKSFIKQYKKFKIDEKELVNAQSQIVLATWGLNGLLKNKQDHSY